MTIRHNILSAVALSGIIFASHAGVSHAGEANKTQTFKPLQASASISTPRAWPELKIARNGYAVSPQSLANRRSVSWVIRSSTWN